MGRPAGYEVLGIGSPFIDLTFDVKEEFLEEIPGAKGGMVLVDHKTLLSIVQTSRAVPLITAGGSCANTIRGLANLKYKCAFIGKVGKDEAGKKFLESLESLHITSLLLQSETPTAQAVCLITPDQERTMRSFLGAAQELSAEDLIPALFKGVRLVHIEGYTLINQPLVQTAMQLADSAGAKVSFDLGSFEVVKAHKELLLDLLKRYVDVVFANQDEVQALTGRSPEEGCRMLQELCGTAVVMLGKNGCLAARYEKLIHCPAVPVKAVDTTGAGDIFISGFLHGYLQGKPLEECARYGTLTGAAVVQVRGVELPPAVWKSILVD